MLGLATCSLGAASMRLNSPSALITSFFAFEACVGIYFPSISTLRSKYIPESHSGVIRTLIGIPQNVLVVLMMLFAKRLGIKGALGTSGIVLSIAMVAHLYTHLGMKKELENAKSASEQ